MIYATDSYDRNGCITFEELSRTLNNIGAKNELSIQEIQVIVEELGDPSPAEQTITVERMLKIL